MQLSAKSYRCEMSPSAIRQLGSQCQLQILAGQSVTSASTANAYSPPQPASHQCQLSGSLKRAARMVIHRCAILSRGASPSEQSPVASASACAVSRASRHRDYLVQLAKDARFNEAFEEYVGRTDDVVVRVSRQQFGFQHFIGLVGVIPDFDTGFALEIRNRVRCDVVRPVINVQRLLGPPEASRGLRKLIRREPRTT